MEDFTLVLIIALSLASVAVVGLLNEHLTLHRLKHGRLPSKRSALLSCICFVIALGGIGWHVHESAEMAKGEADLQRRLDELELRFALKEEQESRTAGVASAESPETPPWRPP